MIASRHILAAIESLRRISDTKARREQLHHLLLTYQQNAMAEMLSHTESINIADCVKTSTERVRNRDLWGGLIVLAKAFRPQSVADLRKNAESVISSSVARFICPTVIVNEKGRTVARPPQPISGNMAESEGAIRAEMVDWSNTYRNLAANGIIDPMRAQILLEHEIRLWHFGRVVNDNPFVPPGREPIYARGLLAGMQGDYTVALHLLIPQFEESIRYILAQHGVITSGLDADGIQNEHDLNSTLYNKGLLPILGDDLVFDLQSLLVDHGGANLRNRFAHGLIHPFEFNSPPAIYFWWLVLRLCLLPLIRQLSNADHSSPSNASDYCI